MKNRLFNTILLFAAVGMMFTACKKEYPQPPIQELPIGTVYTIDQILEMPQNTVFDTASVYGIVTADEQSGNLYKSAYIQDRATGAAIQLYLDAVSGLRIGDSVRIYLKDVTYMVYHNLPQLSGFGPDGHIVILANNRPIEPRVTTIADINAGNHLAQLVKVENVSFVDQGDIFAPATGYGEHNIKDEAGNTVMVRTSNYANFAGDTLPTGTGSLIAIASVYNSTWQLTIRSKSELVFDGGDTPTPTPPPTPTELEGDGSRENPYTANDVILLATEATDGNSYWVKDYIVGSISTGGTDNTYVFAAESDIASNIILSSNIDASSEGECVPVQLPPGDVRTGLNLMDHPENYKQEVLLYGTLEKYFSKPGIKNVTYAEINGNSLGTDPSGSGDGSEYLNQPLTTQASFDTFSAYSVAGNQVWSFDSRYGATMSGYANSNFYANEDWFISPAIDLSGSTNPILVFDHARGPAGSINVGVAEGYYTVWVSNDYATGEAPGTANWTELTGVIHGTTAWGWVSSGNLAIPDAYKTSTCRIAFRYLSIDGASATWEVKNVMVKEQ